MHTRLIAFILLAAAANGALAAEAADPNRAANSVTLDAAGIANLGLKTEEAVEQDFEETAFALGTIEVLAGNRAVVSSRIAGRAQSVIGKKDMQCEAGDELIWVESREFGNPPPVIRLDAPIAGLIAKVNVAQGQPVGPEDSLMEIYDLSTVEAKAAVPQHLTSRIGKGMEAHISVPGFEGRVWESVMAHTGADADGTNGTVEAAFHVPNEDGVLRPGMRAEFSLVLAKRPGVMSIPREALQGDSASRFVFVRDSDPKLKRTFLKTPVVVGQMNDRYVEILEGLLPADEVVTRGAYSLAFAGKGSVSLKEELDRAHGHKHNEDGSEMSPAQQAAEAAAKDGHAHGHEDEGGSLFWKVTSGVLLVLLVVSGIKRKTPVPVNP